MFGEALHFLNPAGWWWAAALAAPIILYLVRPRPRRLRVATLAFYLAPLGKPSDTPWLQRLKRLLSFVLSALLLLAAAMALAKPVIAPSADGLKTAVVVVDRSAAMGAVEDGRTRLAAAVALARIQLDALPTGAAVAVIAYDRRADIVLPRTTDRRAAVRALEALLPRPIAADESRRAAALALAARLAAIEAPGAVWECTARPDPDAAIALPASVSYLRLGVGRTTTINAGIAACDVRPLPMDAVHQELYLALVASAPCTATAEISLDGRPIALRSVEFTADHREERVVLPLEPGPSGGVLTVHVTTPGDALACDDRVELVLPPPRPLTVAVIGPAPDPFLQLALAGFSADQIKVELVKPEAWKIDLPADVLLFTGWLPDTWPTGRPVVICDPPHALAPLLVTLLPEGVGVDGPRTPDPGHPVLYGVASPRVTLWQQAVLGADSGLAPLWSSAVGPLLLAGEVHGARAVVMSLAPGKSERLALLASWPLLIGNSLLWAGQPAREAAAGRRCRTGDVIAVHGSELRWAAASTETPTEPASSAGSSTFALRGGWAELDRVGRWSTDGGDSGTAGVFSAEASGLGAAVPATGSVVASISNTSSTTASLTARWLSGDLVPLLAAFAAALLLSEAWLCHRRGIH